MMMDLLKLLKEAMLGKFSVIEEDDDNIIFENDFKTLWGLIMNNKQAIERLYCTEDAELQMPNLFEELKLAYVDLFEQVSSKLDSRSETFEKFKGHNIEKLLFDSLVHLGEHTSY
mmetsp:Transcript_13313/g.18714  ORF Transcript_13313/g.18714 Transcript_13313/m.18714 type:complete len:115 (-) Transcript_13313:337-681(-)